MLAVLLAAHSAAAQPAPPRALRQRDVTVAGSGAPVPEVHLAPDLRTLLSFDADIDKDSVVLDATRVQLVDAGARSLVLQLRVKLDAHERLWLSVRFRDDSTPQEALLALVSRPSEVDLQVNISRHIQTLAACQAELAQAQAQAGAGTLADLVVSGVLDEHGLSTSPLTITEVQDANRSSLKVSGWVHAGPGWFVLALRIPQPPSGQPWEFQEASLTAPATTPNQLTVRGVRAKRMLPRPEALVVVDVLSPEPPARGEYILSLKVPSQEQPAMTLTFMFPRLSGDDRASPAEPAP
ncbi:DUF2381 family protein [Hyalangium minutum]|uniref:DUF2381 family protein n=1 Tax=Hyalangium minutum TaxID=394096 RepID=A0A085WTW9_9BACT|nr:DUF2381 family protein [Hyalangium minutum]KFE71132.1 hypothetical protein DB31_3262 [Hyalangium minutum]